MYMHVLENVAKCNEQVRVPGAHFDVHDVRIVEVLQQVFHFNEN